MSFCSNCGTQLPENAPSCPNCGSVVYQYVNQNENTVPAEQPAQTAEQPVQPQQPPVQPNYQQPPVQPTYQPYNPQQPQGFVPPQPTDVAVMQSVQYNNTKTAKTLGILAIVFAFISPLVSWILGGIGISKANGANNFAAAYGDAVIAQNAKSAKTLNIVGIVISLVMMVISIIIIAVANS